MNRIGYRSDIEIVVTCLAWALIRASENESESMKMCGFKDGCLFVLFDVVTKDDTNRIFEAKANSVENITKRLAQSLHADMLRDIESSNIAFDGDTDPNGSQDDIQGHPSLQAKKLNAKATPCPII